MNAQIEDVLAEMTQRLVREFAPEQVILFGSHAWGEPNADSGVDLFVVVKESDETPIQRGLRARGVLTGVGVSKDILVETRAELERRRTVIASWENLILKSGRRLYQD